MHSPAPMTAVHVNVYWVYLGVEAGWKAVHLLFPSVFVTQTQVGGLKLKGGSSFVDVEAVCKTTETC